MVNTVIQLYNGNLEPIRHLGKGNSEIKHLEYLIGRNGEDLEKSLGDASRKCFEKYKDCINEYISLLSEQAFCDGFCLGTKLTAEVLISADQFRP